MNLKLKDLFTVATVVLGFAAVALAAKGEFGLASVLIVLGAFFDLGDGYVARLTKTQNKFGAEFDCIADLVIYSFAPAALVFFCFEGVSFWYGFIVGVLPLLFGCLRLARFNVKRIEYPGFWIGLPRPGVAAVVVSFLNSSLFLQFNLFWVGGLIVLLSSMMSLSLLPFPGHHKREISLRLKLVAAFIFISVIIASFAGAVWDVLFLYSSLYLMAPLFSLSSEERIHFNAFVKSWKLEENSEY